MRAGQGIDQLPGDAHASSRLAYRALEDIAHAELAPDLLHVDGAALVREGRIAGNDEQPADLAQSSDDFFDHAVGEILLLGIAAHIGEGQHRDRRLVGQREGGLGGVQGAVRNPISTNAVYPQGARNVLQLLLAHIFKDEVELARGISLHPRRYANSTRLSQTFQASRDIHSIPEDVVVFTTISPIWMPTRNSMRRSGGTSAFRLAMPFCTSVAQRRASTTLENSTAGRPQWSLRCTHDAR